MNIKILYTNNFNVNDIIIFVINKQFYEYYIRYNEFSKAYFLSYKDGPANDIIFNVLQIDKSEFMKKLFNIESSGSWPEVHSLNMLKKQIIYLKNFNEF